MFDKLIVSDEQGAEFKGRSRYFMVSTFVVGILFATALVFSLYAADIGLGVASLEVSMMVAPVTPDAPEEPKPKHAQAQPQTTQRSEMTVRNQNILRPEENPTRTPTDISVTPNTGRSRPNYDFVVRGGLETDAIGSSGINAPGSGSSESGTSSAPAEPVAAVEKLPEPPAIIKTVPPIPKMISKGVINGQAKDLPAPPYPAPARLVNAYGAVNVQIVIDETGKVISSKALTGHPLLKGAAEKAAWNAKFSPTYLSDVPVKVTGVIVYNFKRN
jgi:TonB family protein